MGVETKVINEESKKEAQEGLKELSRQHVLTLVNTCQKRGGIGQSCINRTRQKFLQEMIHYLLFWLTAIYRYVLSR